MVHARGDERRDVRVEADAGDVEEHTLAELARVDLSDRRRGWRARSPSAGSNGIRSSRARPLPDPPGMMPRAGPARFASRPADALDVCTSARPTSLIVPSPPHAMTSSTPAATASSASSCAWPTRSVSRISACDAEPVERALCEPERARQASLAVPAPISG